MTTRRQTEGTTARSFLARLTGRKPEAVELIGRDLAHRSFPIRRRSLLPPIAVAVIGALCFVALRTDIIRIRYALAKQLAHESELMESHRKLNLEAEHLRNAARIAVRARELGFARPERLIDLPAVPDPRTGGAADALAHVGMRP